MNKITIRTASADDYQAVCDLLTQADAYHAEILPSYFQTFTGPVRPKEYINPYIFNEDSDIILAQLAGRAVGCLLLKHARHPDYPMFKQHDFAFIGNFVVDQAHRRLGIGSALLDQAKTWARKRNLQHIQLETWSANETALKFYQKRDFKIIRQIMQLEL